MRPITSLLIANRGEIAVRIARAAAALGIRSIAVYSEDEADSPYLGFADGAVPLPGRGAGSYLDVRAIIEAAVKSGCDAIHPGYGFLSENLEFARACAESGLKFVGPSAASLARFGDKSAARELAGSLGVPLLPGTGPCVTPQGVRDFITSLGGGRSIMLKAVSGGGGRGMRIVTNVEAVDAAFASCASEAEKAFGCADLYAEQLVRRARHVEIQIVGDGRGGIVHLGDRECT